MINLYTNLGSSKINTKLINFIYSACESLDINKNTYDLHVDFEHDFEQNCEHEFTVGFEAFTHGDTDEAIITIDANLPFEEMIKTLSHELIHAKQFLKGDLVNQTYKGVDCSLLEYSFKPWEIEAFDRESEIAKLY